MGATSGIYIETWLDYPFSQVVTILLQNGLDWSTVHDLDGNPEYVFDYYEKPLDSGNPDSAPIAQREAILADLDEKSQNGLIVEVHLLLRLGEELNTLDFMKNGPEKFAVYLNAPLRIAGTWLTDFSPFVEKLVAPLVKNGINIREVRYENDYY